MKTEEKKFALLVTDLETKNSKDYPWTEFFETIENAVKKIKEYNFDYGNIHTSKQVAYVEIAQKSDIGYTIILWTDDGINWKKFNLHCGELIFPHSHPDIKNWMSIGNRCRHVE